MTLRQGNIKNDATGDVACDHYHKYREDFQLMKRMGIKNYRSGPRLHLVLC
jgi:beta-glucosidase